MNTVIKNKALAYRRLILERFFFFYHLYQQAIFWGLRLLLAFLLLLLSLSPSVSGLTQAICLAGLLIVGIICFLDKEQLTNSKENSTQTRTTTNAAERSSANTQANKKRTVNETMFQPLEIRQIVSEVNDLIQKKNIARKTIELFVLPSAYGKRHAVKAIDQLRSAGYAIRLYTDADMPNGMQHDQQNLIGECNGYVHVYISG